MPSDDALSDSNAQESQSALSRATSEFLTVTAHKIHTPVTTIKWQVELLQSEGLGPLTSDQRAVLGTIMDAANRLNDLSRALLYVFELEKDLPLVQPREVDCRVLVAKIIKNLSALAEERKVHVEFIPPDVPLVVYLDQELAFVVLRTLLENAIVYSKAGGEVHVELMECEGGAKVRVVDSGCGIPPRNHHLVFTKFFRARNAKQCWTEGTGLGLYIAHTIVSRTSGELSFKSDEDKGSEFTWRIPGHTVGRQPWEQCSAQHRL